MNPILSNHVKHRTSPSRDSNYCDIIDLYECSLNQSYPTGSLSTSYDYSQHQRYSLNLVNRKNILYFVRINPFKIATMEPLHLDNRLIGIFVVVFNYYININTIINIEIFYCFLI